MDQIEQNSTAQGLIRSLKNEVSRGKKDSDGEVKDMFKKLNSWIEDSQTQIFSTINAHALGMNRDLEELNETICDLDTKLSLVTKERDDLLDFVNNLSSGIRQWSAKLPGIQSLSEPEKCHNKNDHEVDLKGIRDTRVQGARGPRYTNKVADQENDVESIDHSVQQHLQTPLIEHNNLNDRDTMYRVAHLLADWV